MIEDKTIHEFSATTVDDAVASGLLQLGLKRESVDLEIVDQGSRGIFGLGSRPARVRLMVLKTEISTPVLVQKPDISTHNPIKKSDFTADEGKPPVQENLRQYTVASTSANVVPQIEMDEDQTLQTARAVISELLEKMKINATLKVSYPESGDSRDRETVMVDIEGNDLSILIGRRSETLYALQYIAGLIISKELDRLIPVVIDVQGYRMRRERQLQQLARRMADQALHTGKRQSLEPMPANERRIIHIELRDNPKVTTESTGDEPNRKVTILPKK